MVRSPAWVGIAACLVLLLGAPGSLRAAGNTPPVAVDDPSAACGFGDVVGGSFPIPEDWQEWFVLTAGACSPLANDYDPDGDPLTFELVGQPAHGEAMALPDGFLAYHVEPDYSTLPGNVSGGTWVSTTITYRLFDGTAYSNDAAYRLWIAPINDAPSFTPGPSLVEAVVGDGLVIRAWATSISPGPANESHQAVSFEILSIDQVGAPSMFSSLPVIDSAGILRFTPGSEPGLATVTVRARDDGGLESYYGLDGRRELVPPVDRSDPVSFQVVVYGASPTAVPSSSASPRASPVPTSTDQPSWSSSPGATPPASEEPSSSITPDGGAAASPAPTSQGPTQGNTASGSSGSPANSAPGVGSTGIPGVGRAGSTPPTGPGGEATGPDAAPRATAAPATRDGVAANGTMLAVSAGLGLLAALGLGASLRMRRRR
jgi:hypothetical protein